MKPSAAAHASIGRLQLELAWQEALGVPWRAEEEGLRLLGELRRDLSFAPTALDQLRQLHVAISALRAAGL